MALSITKLERLLNSKGLIIKKILTIDSMCVYVEILSTVTADNFLLYIPRKYKISADGREGTYVIKSIDIEEDYNLTSEYAGDPDNFELEKTYDEVEIAEDYKESSHEDMEEFLEDKYNHPISLKDISKDDKGKIREIYRQLRRLKFCVQNIQYKLCIAYSNYICTIQSDETIECFEIKHMKNTHNYRLIVTIDLESFYKKIESVSIDINTIRQGLYQVLDKNHYKHTINLQKMMEHNGNLAVISDTAMQKKNKYTVYLTQLESLLGELNILENNILEKIMSIHERYKTDTSLKGLHSDIEKSQAISSNQKKLEQIGNIKKDVVSNILAVKEKQENIVIMVDKICFDNAVMIDAITKNFTKLTEI